MYGLLAEERGRYRYSVAWIDGMAGGRHLGRSVLTRANHAVLADLSANAQHDPLCLNLRTPLRVPVAPPVSVVTSRTVSAFNEMWYRRAPRHRTGELVPLARFFYPLDGVAGWNLLYGPHGFTQYQFVVPLGAEAVVRAVLERLSRARAASLLAVLKRFGSEGSGHLSFPREGWTLALDVPLGLPGLAVLLDGLDELVASAGGRVYLAKDGPRTDRECWRRCIRASRTGWRFARVLIPRGCSTRTWRVASGLASHDVHWRSGWERDRRDRHAADGRRHRRRFADRPRQSQGEVPAPGGQFRASGLTS